METLDRVALMRKTMPDLRHIIRRLGGDSPQAEGRESLVSRILMFAPQKWEQEKKIKREPVQKLTALEVSNVLKPYLLRGMKLHIENDCWFISAANRKDSGSMYMPPAVIERTAKYLMPKDM